MKQLSYRLFSIAILGALLMSCQLSPNKIQAEPRTEFSTELIPHTDDPHAEAKSNSIQVALLLDTSNSMDGLIDQAKSRLWNIVNTLTTLKYDGKSPNIEISLYEYGNDGLEESDNYIRKVTKLTDDLDLISEQLFALRTNGGQEYCGAVINEASTSLSWSNDKSMKLIYIAGNEAFTQGGVNYKEAISDARDNDIFINTIFCGDRDEGINTMWEDGAMVGDGKYFNIDADKKVVYIPTPYDDRIRKCNLRLNDTYIGYGSQGSSRKMQQVVQDSNASSMSEENSVERTIAKSKKAAYKNESWDVVDKAESDEKWLEQAKDSELPKEMKGMNSAERKAFVTEKAKERADIQKEIAELSVQREEFIQNELSNRGNEDIDDLGEAIKKSIIEIGKVKGFTPAMAE